ncbi:hypothetical protein N7532_001021 [Penicillium argentinense]|uniref:Uncharacterized protein n=1 Tax=Penicillium argentinense TaxID=1131581 RepID=A0A9W9G1P7_9EURO|nr:uncharacterized protein N7532_001021 [Penicillium argentinense]KAJ5110486.1 hypothetical protein N7532_001021 [Penicillium argentinense]
MLDTHCRPRNPRVQRTLLAYSSPAPFRAIRTGIDVPPGPSKTNKHILISVRQVLETVVDVAVSWGGELARGLNHARLDHFQAPPKANWFIESINRSEAGSAGVCSLGLGYVAMYNQACRRDRY